MTAYEHGFLSKCAESGLSETDAKALMDFVSEQKAKNAKQEAQKQVLRDANRKERVRTARLAMMAMLGSAGGLLGRVAGRGLVGSDTAEAVGMLAGGLAGGIGGWHWGKTIGNRDADRQEEWEDRTGQDIASQNTQRAANIAAYSSILNSRNPVGRAARLRILAPHVMY